MKNLFVIAAATGVFVGVPAERCLADTEKCVDNGVPGVPATHQTCVSWSRSTAPVENFHFRVDYGSPNAPDVELVFGDAGPEAGWHVWAVDLSQSIIPTPAADLGAVTVDPTTPDDFDITIARYPSGTTGAINVASISLVPLGDNYSSLTSASNIGGNLTGALTVQKDLAGNGGDVDLRVGGDVNGAITADTITNLDITGSLNAAINAVTITNLEVGGSVNAGVDVEGVITAMDVAQDVAGHITAGDITSLLIHGDLTGNITCTGTITSAHIYGSVSGDAGSVTGNITATTITTLDIDDDLSGGTIRATDVTDVTVYGNLAGSLITVTGTVEDLEIRLDMLGGTLDLGEVTDRVSITGELDATSTITIDEIDGDSAYLLLSGDVSGDVTVDLLKNGGDVMLSSTTVASGFTITVTDVQPGVSPNLSVLDFVGNAFYGSVTLGNGIPEDFVVFIGYTYVVSPASLDLTADNVEGTLWVPAGGALAVLNGGAVMGDGYPTFELVAVTLADSGATYSGSASFKSVSSGATISLAGATLDGSLDINGAMAGTISVGTANGDIDITGDLSGDVSIGGDASADIDVGGDVTSTGSIAVTGQLGSEGRIRIDGLCDAPITIGKGTAANTLIRVTDGLDDGAMLLT